MPLILLPKLSALGNFKAFPLPSPATFVSNHSGDAVLRVFSYTKKKKTFIVENLAF